MLRRSCLGAGQDAASYITECSSCEDENLPIQCVRVHSPSTILISAATELSRLPVSMTECCAKEVDLRANRTEIYPGKDEKLKGR